MYIDVEDVDCDENGVHIIARVFQKRKEVPSDSPTFDEGVLFIETRNMVIPLN